MSTTKLRKLETKLIAAVDGALSKPVADALVKSAQDGRRITQAESNELLAILNRYHSRWEPEAAQALQAAISLPASPTPAGLAVKTGRSTRGLRDDKVFVTSVVGQTNDTGRPGFSRGYVALSEGILRTRHGSAAPATPLMGTQAPREVKSTPGASLDEMARLFGFAGQSFATLASSEQFFKPDAAYWEGMCHAWARLALSADLSAAVEVEGERGQRGVWLGGQWLSRADLGNWLMALGDKVTQDFADEQLYDADLTPQELLSAVGQMLKPGEHGFVADIVNDKFQGHREVWNQPFTGYALNATQLPPEEAEGFLRLASQGGALAATGVQFVELKLTYLDEASDGHEEEANRSTRTVGMYVVTNPEGQMVGGYYAGDDRLEGLETICAKYERAVSNLSYEIPEHLVQPRLNIVTAARDGTPSRVLENNELGAEFRFFVHSVLGKGVSGERRAAFEQGVLNCGPTVSAAERKTLIRDFPGVANAYSPSQWEALFGARKLADSDFGAAWV